MTVQRLHPHLGPLDILTNNELKDAMGHALDGFIRDFYRGIKIIKLPIIRITAAGTGPTLLAQNPNGGAPIGPESGFIWRLLRVTLASNGVDSGAATLYVGSDPTNLDIAHQVDNTLKIGQAYYPGNRGVFIFPDEFIFANLAVTVAANQYALNGLAAEVPAEMVGKIAGG